MGKKMNNWRADFPILAQKVNDEPLVYLDNAATTQKPLAVLQTVRDFYENDNANIHRGVHTLAQRATERYEQVRQKVTDFIHGNDWHEVVFTKGTTEALNWVAASYGATHVKAGDEIVLSYLEHHSNLVPWQQLAKKVGAKLKYIELTADGQLDLQSAADLITDRTAIVALCHASNVMGVVNPIQAVSQLAHAHGAVMVVDGAQAVPHLPVDVQELGADFYAFSGHKMLAPTGVGVLWGKLALLNEMPPLEFGGEMIANVGLYETDFKEVPYKFEGGTQNIAGVIGLGAAIDYLQAIGLEQITKHEQELISYVLPQLQAIDGLEIYGPQDPSLRTGILSFNLTGLHPHDLASALDMDGVAVRAGHHCAQPLMNYLGVSATARASFYLYNTKEDADLLIKAILDAKEFFLNGSC
ncbi:cysteine desulfurase [Ligilactobacillus pabuli]|uniref:cysteine desulfurase n=1 Tax=Ligilactobacillus pabuli TaxID=2886039 RepID=A0ABQ5JJZ8_9LACO|nr:cysteine desulfurase [Ligilactobacillus pabuli]GKS82392.1 cysteine desulfurase [Ligilactobacillus pabuli]